MVRELSSLSDFNDLVAKNTVVVVDFHATWCGPCKVIAPTFEKLAGQYKQATFVKCDVDRNQDISQTQGVRAMPTFNIYRSGKKVATIMGADARKLEAAVREHAGAPSQTASSSSTTWGKGNVLGDTETPSKPVSAPLSDPAHSLANGVTNLDPTLRTLLLMVAVGTDCSLCEVAKDALDELKRDRNLAFELETVNIRDKADPSVKKWRRLYQYDIPVLHLNGRQVMKHRIQSDQLASLIQAAAQEKTT